MDFKVLGKVKLNVKQFSYVMLFGILALLPLIIKSLYWQGVLVLSFYYMLLALGWDLIMGYTGQFSWGQQIFSAISAYTSSILSVRFGFPLPVSILVGVGVGTLTGLAIGVIVFRMRGFYLCLTTWVLGETLHTFLCVEESLTGGTKGMYTPRFFNRYELPYYYLGLGIVIFVIFIFEKIVNSRIGLYLHAIRDDEDVAEILGVDTFKWKTLAFVISSFPASLAGIFYAHSLGLIAPAIASSLIMGYLTIMVVLGGMGTLIGPVIGALFTTVVLEYVRGIALHLSLLTSAIVVLVMMRSIRGGLVELFQKIYKYFKGY